MSPLERLLSEEWPDGTFGGPAALNAPVTPRGWCAWCGRQAALNADGTLRAHRTASNDPARCTGSGYRPTSVLRTTPTRDEIAARHRAELLAALDDTGRRQPTRQPASRQRKAAA
ncbi:hypothetical protein ACIA6C_27900 [Streptomyces sp. NPDC051578]|uniref:hypothetical protein n=1 Tax=Streptomyces sp. NPDC051578 TaxID=3365662 RepID=UPI0037AB4E82